MSKKDKEIVYYYSKFLNDPDKASLYNKKIKVESNGKQYTAFVQDSLIPYLKTPSDNEVVGQIELVVITELAL